MKASYKAPLLISIIIASSLLQACVVEPAHRHYVSGVVLVAPPAPRHEIIGVAPARGYVWIDGYWSWNAGHHDWVTGHWEAPRRGYRWVPHRWHHERDGWHLQEGYWQRR
ncbi:MAG TPA: YXWGXW repeat-containing protein [Steroidobacteraceae bacterium]|nr:YXWGXW repeat-containing protein [Steroidobacteraceae bacterium]